MIDRRSVGHSLLVSSSHLRPTTRIFSCQKFNGFWCGALSLTRGRVCRLQLLLLLARAVILGSESCGTHDHTLLSQIRDSPNMEGQVPVFISPMNRVTQLYTSGIGFPFRRLLRFAALRWRYSNPPPRGKLPTATESELFYDWRLTANQFVLTASPLRLTTREFLNWTLAVIVLIYNILSKDRMGLSLMNNFGLFKYTFRTYSILLKILDFALYKSPLSVQALQSRSCLSYLYYATTAA
jgi:hypothetical protein